MVTDVVFEELLEKAKKLLLQAFGYAVDETDVVFEELLEKAKKLLLQAFDYAVDETGVILDSSGERIKSKENPAKLLRLSEIAIIPGSLDIIDGSPVSISKFIREKIEA